MQTANANDLMQAYAADAVQYALKLNKDLDYSPESIEVLEDICRLLYKKRVLNFWQRLITKPPSEQNIIDMASRLGAYLGEVIKLKMGGTWKIEDPTGEGNTMVLQFGEVKVFPVARVYWRLQNGAENNLWHYFNQITADN